MIIFLTWEFPGGSARVIGTKPTIEAKLVNLFRSEVQESFLNSYRIEAA
jgi:hypothetical protein